MALRKIGMLRRSTVVSVVALVLATGAFAVALTAVAGSRDSGRELSGRLVPEAAAVDELLRLFAAQQASLRDAVTSGVAGELAAFEAEGGQLVKARDTAVALARGDQLMATWVGKTMTAYRAWLTRVADPQVAALRRGDITVARALQANLQLVTVSVLAVRVAGLTLQAEITGEQQTLTGRLNRFYDTLLGALIAMFVMVAGIAVGIIVAVGRGLLRPFRELNRSVAAVADGSYGTRIPAIGPVELFDLSRGIERMRTRLVAALDERQRAQESLRGLFDLAPDAMLAATPDGTIMMANVKAVEAYGYTAEELIGRKVKTLLPKEWRAGLAAVSQSHRGDRRTWPDAQEIKSAGLRRDGTTFPCEVRLSWLPTDHGTLIVSAIRDVTERLAMEAERERLRLAGEQERLQQRLQQSRRLESLGQLVGGVAHDFNTLLNIIAGYADFAAERLTSLTAEESGTTGEESGTAPVLADIEQVRIAAQQAIRVTRQLLTFSRSEEDNREILDVNEVAQSAGQLLGRSLGEQIDLAISTEPGLWPVEADRGQLEQVLVNVALNARDAMPGGGHLTIETSNAEVDDAYAAQRPSLEPGRYCRLAVSDTGTGMDAATIERVFEPFFSTKPRGRGTGLGLATVYGIVTGLGGAIDVYSKKGFGTTVTVLLPVAEQVVEHVTGQLAPAEADGPAEDLGGHGEAILLVEDEESLRAMASRILTKNGYQVRAAEGGADAVRQSADPAQPIDLLVTDMVMPGMLGIEVVARVHAARPRLPALFISGYAQQVLDFHGIPVLNYDILQKPFTEAALLTRVRRALNRSAAARRK